MEYLPFGELLVDEHKNSYNTPYKFNAKELDEETGNYYYGARYYNPKWSIFIQPDPLSEMYPGISSYSYVLQNPIRYTDPTGMAAEEADCGIGCTIRKVFNNVVHPGQLQNPDGTLSRKKSRATGWTMNDKGADNQKEQKEPIEGRTPVEAIANLNTMGINPFNPANIQMPGVTPPIPVETGTSSIRIDDREIGVFGPQSINFKFSTIGSTASKSTDGIRTGINSILPLTNSQKQNLQAIANYLIANPQATIRFQYPAPLSSSHPNFNADVRGVYQMNFSQMTEFLKQMGVTDHNRRVLMNFGVGFDSILNPGN